MGSAGIELPEPVTLHSVERGYRKAMEAMESRNHNFSERGMRAARSRDARLLLVLEKAAEVLHERQEQQIGRTQRSWGSTEGEKADLTEYTLFREAYRLCDEGQPLYNFCWIYGAAAYLAGY